MNQPIPDSFGPFLQSLSFDPPSSDATPITTLWTGIPSRTAIGHQFVKPPKAMFQIEPTQITLAGARKKLLQLLREAKHFATDEIADAVLSCSVFFGKTGVERTAFLNEVLGNIQNADVMHFFILPFKAVAAQVTFDGYKLGELDMAVLASRCDRVPTDYLKLYARQISGQFSIQSPGFKHGTINFIDLAKGAMTNPAFQDLLLNYFERLSRQHFEFMWDHLNKTQLLAAALDANIIDVQNIRDTAGRLSNRITIYLDLCRKGGGYLVPEGSGMTLNQLGPDSETLARFIENRQTYHLSEVNDSELGRTLLACAGFCQQATRFLANGRADDAALYATICLEHIFSEKQSTSEAVCTRTAALTYSTMMPGYSEAEKELRKLYDARSGFVHSGKSVAPVQAERLIAYAQEAIRRMLILHLKTGNRSTGFLNAWTKKLDYVISGFNAGVVVEAALLLETGVRTE